MKSIFSGVTNFQKLEEVKIEKENAQKVSCESNLTGIFEHVFLVDEIRHNLAANTHNGRPVQS